MRRVLLLTPIELTIDPRARRQATAALRAGWDVVGVCGQASGDAPAPLDAVRIVRVGKRGRASTLWSLASPKTSGGATRRELRALLRLVRMLARNVTFVRAGRALGRFDIVHANDLGTLPAAILLARRMRARVVYDAHELYSEFDAPQPRIARRLTLALERALARRAAAVVTVSDELAAELVDRLALRRRPVVVLNAPDRVDVESPAHDDDAPLLAIYQGRLGPGRALDDLLAAAEADATELFVRIPHAAPDAVRAAAARRGVGPKVHVLDPVAAPDAVAALTQFEVGVIFDRPVTRNAQLSFPNKLFEYLMAGLAVVAPALESIGPLLERERVGLTYPPGDRTGLPRTLERLAGDRALLRELRTRARELAVSRLNADAAAATLVAVWEGRGEHG